MLGQDDQLFPVCLRLCVFKVKLCVVEPPSPRPNKKVGPPMFGLSHGPETMWYRLSVIGYFYPQTTMRYDVFVASTQMRKLREQMTYSRSYSKDVMEPEPRPALLTTNKKPLTNNWILPSSMQKKNSQQGVQMACGLSDEHHGGDFCLTVQGYPLSALCRIWASVSYFAFAATLAARVWWEYSAGRGRTAYWGDSVSDVFFLQGILPSWDSWDWGIFWLLAHF